jgi:hypothetical protein
VRLDHLLSGDSSKPSGFVHLGQCHIVVRATARIARELGLLFGFEGPTHLCNLGGCD